MFRQPKPAGWEDAQLAIQEVGGWIKNADTKATILAAATGVVLTSALTSVDRIEAGARTLGAPWGWVLAFSCVISTIAIVLTVVCLTLALIPRRTSTPGNRFAWTELAKLNGRVEFPVETAREEAWVQARDLAQIAAAKYSWFGRALLLFVVSVTVFGFALAWSVLG